jgi:hypothetical protein
MSRLKASAEAAQQHPARPVASQEPANIGSGQYLLGSYRPKKQH